MVNLKQLYKYYAGGGKEPYDPNQHFLHAVQVLLALTATPGPHSSSSTDIQHPDGFDAVVEKRCAIDEANREECPECPEDLCLLCVKTFTEKNTGLGDAKAYFTCIGKKEFALGPEERGKKPSVAWWHILLGFGILLSCFGALLCYRFCVDFCEICSHCNPVRKRYPAEAQEVARRETPIIIHCSSGESPPPSYKQALIDNDYSSSLTMKK